MKHVLSVSRKCFANLISLMQVKDFLNNELIAIILRIKKQSFL